LQQRLTIVPNFAFRAVIQFRKIPAKYQRGQADMAITAEGETNYMYHNIRLLKLISGILLF